MDILVGRRSTSDVAAVAKVNGLQALRAQPAIGDRARHETRQVREDRRRLARLAPGEAELPEVQPVQTLLEGRQLGEGPGRPKVRIEEEPLLSAKRGGTVVPEPTRQEELVPQVESRRREVTGRPDLLAILVRRAVDREVQLVRAEDDDVTFDLIPLELLLTQVLTHAQASRDVLVEVVATRQQQRPVDIEGRQVRANQATVRELRGALREERVSGVAGVVGAQRRRHVQPVQRLPVQVHVTEHAIDLRRVRNLVHHEERVVVAAARRQRNRTVRAAIPRRATIRAV